jgi:hypothetical protein
MRIYGLPGTTVPTLIVSPGSTQIMLANLQLNTLVFPSHGGAKEPSTSYCSFFHLNGLHVAFEPGSRVQDLQFVGLTQLRSPDPVPRDQSVAYTHGGIHVDGGANVTNCKFVRLMVHAYSPTFTVNLAAGDGGAFKGNTILWENSLGAMQATYNIAGADEFTAVGTDVESYGSGYHNALFTASGGGVFRVYGVHGRLMEHGGLNATNPATGVFDTEVDSMLNIRPVVSRGVGGNMSTAGIGPDLIYRAKMGSLVQLAGEDYTVLDYAPPGPLRALVTARGGIVANAKRVSKGALTLPEQAVLSKVIKHNGTRDGAPWGLPDFSNTDLWRAAASAAAATSHALVTQGLATDDSSMIQQLIDATVNSTGGGMLGPGVYHIGKPLKLGAKGAVHQSFLVGAGPAKTFIFSLNPAMSMVVGAGDGGSVHFNLAGVTLAGGAIGIHFTNATFGAHAQITQGQFSHVQLVNFSTAAIHTDDIYGVDNNMWSNLLFENCDIGFWQRAPENNRDPKTGRCLQAFDNPSLNYMDKTVFARVRVIGGRVGFQMDPCRGNGLNMIFESQFENISSTAVLLNGNTDETLVASSRFINVPVAVTGGTGTTMMNSEIVLGPASHYALMPAQCTVDNLPTEVCPGGGAMEGLVVKLGPGANASATLFGPGASGPMVLMNTQTPDMPWGLVQTPRGPLPGNPSTLEPPLPAAQWMLLNNRFGAAAQSGWNKVGLVVSGPASSTATDLAGSTTVVLAGDDSEAAPRSQFLWGPSW